MTARYPRAHFRSLLASLFGAALVLGLAVPGCGGGGGGLQAAGVRVFVLPAGNYRFVSTLGIEFSMPGRPRVRVQQLGTPPRTARREDYDLRMEQNSRGFLLTFIDAREAPNQVPAIEASLADSLVREDARVLEEREVPQAGGLARELVIENVTNNQHFVVARIFEVQGVVVRATAVVSSATATPADVQLFFESIHAAE